MSKTFSNMNHLASFRIDGVVHHHVMDFDNDTTYIVLDEKTYSTDLKDSLFTVNSNADVYIDGIKIGVFRTNSQSQWYFYDKDTDAKITTPCLDLLVSERAVFKQLLK